MTDNDIDNKNSGDNDDSNNKTLFFSQVFSMLHSI